MLLLLLLLRNRYRGILLKTYIAPTDNAPATKARNGYFPLKALMVRVTTTFKKVK